MTELQSTAPACPIDPAQSRVFLTNAGTNSDVVSTYAAADADESFLAEGTSYYYYDGLSSGKSAQRGEIDVKFYARFYQTGGAT